VFVRALWLARCDRTWLRGRDAVGRGRLASLSNTLQATGHSGRVELRDLYETRASVDSDDLARIANLLLLLGVAGTLWSLFDGASAVHVKPSSGDAVGGAEALLPVLRSFNAFSVTIVSVGLAFLVLIGQRVVGRAVTGVAFEAAQMWQGVAAGSGDATGELRAAVKELTASVQALGPQGNGDWARAAVEKIAAELTANARAASQQMTTAAGSFATAFSEAVAPLATRVTGALGPIVDRLDSVTKALERSMQSLDVQRELLEKHAAALEVIHGHLGTAEHAVKQLHDVPAVVGSSLQDIGTHVAGTLANLHGAFEGKLERIFKLHEGAVLTVTTRMRETESELAASVAAATAEVKHYLIHHGKGVTDAVDGMMKNAARASDASIWTPVRRAVDDIGTTAQRATHSVNAVENTAVAAVESVQRSVGKLGDQARAVVTQLDAMRDAVTGLGTSRTRERRSTAVAQWVSTGALVVAMFVLCTLFYTRLGQ
jgi:hypothetical protein